MPLSTSDIPYYDLEHVKQHDKQFNFIHGGRGIGKTFSVKSDALNNFIKTGGYFVYIRRYKREIKQLNNFYLDYLSINPDVDIKQRGNKIYYKDKLFGLICTLSSADSFRGVRLPANSIICFDEYLPLKAGYNRFLPKEVDLFLDVVTSIYGFRDSPIKCYFLANASNPFNPYFEYFKIPYSNKYGIYEQGEILTENISNKKFKTAVADTPLSKLLKDTNYGKYAIDNELLGVDKLYIEKMIGQCKPLIALEVNDKVYYLWLNFKSGIVYITNTKFTIDTIFTLSSKSNGVNYFQIKMRSKNYYMLVVKNAYQYNQIRYETTQIKAIFEPLLYKLL